MSTSAFNPAQPYGALASVYDRMMMHVNYDDWVHLIDRVSSRFLKKAHPSVLELGAGTGVLGSRLAHRGYAYQGCDLSPGMCSEARKRDLSFFTADARAIPVRATYDLLIFLYDGINYLRTLRDYRTVFSEAWRLLHDNGIFLFDITTVSNSRRHFKNFVDCEDFQKQFYARHSYFKEADRLQINDFVIFLQCPQDPACYRRFREHHVQKVFSSREICGAIPADLFQIIGIWDSYSFRRSSSRSERIHICMRRRPVE